MGKMKELFMKQQEHEDDFARHYAEMYKVAEYMGAEKVFDELYKATIEIKPSNKPKKKKNVRKRKR